MYPIQQKTQVPRAAFTLIELLIVVSVIGLLMAILGATISGMLGSAREAQTSATLQKIDGLIVERQQGLERAFDGRDFRRFIEIFHERLIKGDPANGVPQLFGLSQRAVEAGARKDFLRQFFPQNLWEMKDERDAAGAMLDANTDGVADGDGIPDLIQHDSIYGPLVKWANPTGNQFVPYGDTNGNGSYDAGIDQLHDPTTESSELLYFALTRMEVFGTPLVGADEFRTQEVADTDGDGLPEFIDGWGRPLRFYRWSSRLVKPWGLFGFDGVPGATGDDPNTPAGADFADLYELGWPGTDDVVIPKAVRDFANLYISGLPRAPIMVGNPPTPITGDYDQLNEDPDDSFGILLFEARRLTATGIPMLNAVSESRYHTLDTYHRPLVVSAGADGVLGLYEPFHNEDLNFNGLLDPGEDANGNMFLDIGLLAQPLNEDANLDGVQDSDLNGNVSFDSLTNPVAALDDITNRNRRAGQ
jgi:prepilin-type N-terminal cleavage/methylation domain-containing protein